MKKNAVVLLGLICCVPGCSDLGDPYTPPRVLPGVGVDGVRIGDSPSRVHEVLGKASGRAFFSGVHGGGTCEHWDVGPHAGMWVFYYPDFSREDQMGPVDAISVLPPYDGATEDGVGIKSGLGTVLALRPDPAYKSIDSTGSGIVIYCVSHRYLNVTFKDSVVSMVFSGYWDPPKPGEFPFYCP